MATVSHQALTAAPMTLQLVSSRRVGGGWSNSLRLPTPSSDSSAPLSLATADLGCRTVQHSTTCAGIVAWLLAEVCVLFAEA